MTRKVLVVGLDGATWDLIKPWADEGKLPTFKKLLENGTWGRLESTIPSESVPAWPALVTGKNPGKINVFHFLKDLDTGKLNTSMDLKSKTIWDYLSDANYTSCVINIPLTYPPSKLNGVMISGFLTPQGRIYTYPESLTEHLNSIGYKIDLLFKDKYGLFPSHDVVFNRRYELFSEILSIISKRIEVTYRLLDEYDPHFLIVNLKMCDVVQHLFWDEKEKIFQVYELIDNELKNFKSLGDILFLVSDHGFEAKRSKVFNLREWLVRKGYISERTTKRLLRRMAILTGLYKSHLIRKIYSLFKERWGKVKGRKNVGEDRVKPFLGCGLFIKDEKLKTILIKELKEVRDPISGERIFSDVLDAEEVYSGPYIKNGPDILFVPNKDYKIVFSSTPVLIDKNSEHLPGSHEYARYGVFLAYGKGIKKGFMLKNVKIYDIVPTILHIFGLPIPKDVDGRVLREIFEEDSEFAKREPKYVELGEIEKEKIRRRIRELKKQWKK